MRGHSSGAPFDRTAPLYDEQFESLPATARLRRIIIDTAIGVFPPGGSILELNCGTGTDATALGRAGFRVLATDESAEMVRLAREKVLSGQVQSSVTCRQISFDQIGTLRGHQFDGVFSNLGGLNCHQNLSGLARELHALMKHESILLAVLLSPVCMWEVLSFGLRGMTASAFRRLRKDGIEVGLHGSSVRVFFHSPRSVTRAFAPYFSRIMVMGLNIITPPPSFTRAYSILGRATPLVESLEDRIASVPPLNRIGDHYLIALRRSPHE